MFIRRFAPYASHLKAVRFQFGIGLICGIIAAAASGAGLPFVIKFLVPLITSEQGPEGSQLIAILASVPITFGLRAGGSFLNAYFMAYAGMYVLEQLRVMVFEKIQFLPLSFFGQNNVGDLISRVINDAAMLQHAVIVVVNSLIKEPATLLSAVGFLIYLSVTESQAVFMLIALVTVPACVIPIRIIGKRVFQKAFKTQLQAGELNNLLNEKHQRISRAISVFQTTKQQKLHELISELDALSPLSLLNRGFSVTMDQQQKVIKSVQQVKKGQTLQLKLNDGKVLSRVEKIFTETPFNKSK